MKINLHKVPIREVVAGYKNDEEDGVVGFGGRLNIRPPFQRELVYDPPEQRAVIKSIMSEFPLNVMYWVKNGEGSYDLLDGQQRTLSICKYYAERLSVEFQVGVPQSFENLSDEDKDKFLDYKLQIYICEDATAQDVLDWFRIINIAGKKLTDQELLNAVYPGEWLSAAKRYFSKENCPAYKIGEQYMKGSPKRQDYLERVLKWISNGNIAEYMSEHQHDENADAEKQYFRTVINWVEMLFPDYRKEMKNVEWGELYNLCKDKAFSATKLEKEVARLMMDSDVSSRKGIYEYVLTGNERALSLRGFDDAMKRAVYERQKGICNVCGKHFKIEEMEADHITPWSKGGRTIEENCQMLCKKCNLDKSNK